MKIYLIAALCAVSLPAAAADFDYSYLGGGYRSEASGVLESGNGYLLEGSYGFADRFFVSGDFRTANEPEPSSSKDLDVRRRRVGFGVHGSPFDAVDLYVRLYTIKLSVDGPGFGSLSRGGGGIGLGLRARPAAHWELEFSLDMDNRGLLTEYESRHGLGLDMDGQESVFASALRYEATDRLWLGLGYETGNANASSGTRSSSTKSWLLSARWTF